MRHVRTRFYLSALIAIIMLAAPSIACAAGNLSESGPTLSITGICVGPDGIRPEADAFVQVFRSNPVASTSAPRVDAGVSLNSLSNDANNHEASFATMTDRNGVWAITGVSPGKYWITAQALRTNGADYLAVGQSIVLGTSSSLVDVPLRLQVVYFFEAPPVFHPDATSMYYMTGRQAGPKNPVSQTYVNVPTADFSYRYGNCRFESTKPFRVYCAERDQTVLADLANMVRSTPSHQLLVYIHGFNQCFEDAVGTGAYLSSHLHRIVLVLDWPSLDDVKLYDSDIETIDELDDRGGAKSKIRSALEDILDGVGPNVTVAVVAHSMGSRVAVYGLRELAEARSANRSRIVAVILAAADLDVAIYEQDMPYLSDGISLNTYASTKDRALEVSKTASKHARVGETCQNLSMPPNGVCVDASHARAGNGIDALVRHGYFNSDVDLAKDMAQFLDGLSPRSRCYLEPHPDTQFFDFISTCRAGISTSLKQ
jgi:pimeloyl-ACP methyl ester carboxylesterase